MWYNTIRYIKSALKLFVCCITFLYLVTPTLATNPNSPADKTFVRGKVVDGVGDAISGAHVEVQCNEFVRSDTTNGNGKYQVVFPQSECDEGDQVTVYVTKGDQSGSGTGTVKEKNCSIDVAAIRIVLVPEFTSLTGAFAALSSIGALGWFRRREA